MPVYLIDAPAWYEWAVALTACSFFFAGLYFAMRR